MNSRLDKQVRETLTKEQEFERMIQKWKKESVERLNDLRKRKGSKITDTTYIVRNKGRR